MAKATHVVVHRKLFMRVNSELQHVPKGTELTLTSKQADRLEAAGKVAKIGDKKSVDLSGGGDDKLKELKARAAELGIEGASRWGEARLAEEIAKAESALADPGDGEQ